jgi:hypothetical protein
MVAGARYVPNRQFLNIPFRSELVHYTVCASHCDEDSEIVVAVGKFGTYACQKE